MQRMFQGIYSRPNIWLLKFFRKTLLALNSEAEIVKLIEQYEKQVRSIKEEALPLTWAMRGGMTYGEILNVGQEERSIISKIAKDNIETTQKTKLPYF